MKGKICIMGMLASVVIHMNMSAADVKLYQLSELSIKRHASIIKRTMMFHTRIEYTLQFVALTYNLFYFLKGLFPFIEEEKNTLRVMSSYVAEKAPRKWISSSIKDFFTMITTFEFATYLLNSFAHSIVFSITNHALQSSIMKIAHQHTIRWYVQTHASYQQTITLCMKHFERYEQMKDEGNEKLAEQEFCIIVNTCDLIIKDLEAILAYMAFRVDTIASHYHDEAVSTQQLLYNYVIDWQKELNVSLQNKSTEYTKQLLEQCYNQVDRLYAMFALYERHLKHTSLVRKLFY